MTVLESIARERGIKRNSVKTPTQTMVAFDYIEQARPIRLWSRWEILF